jgi:alcohol dehydrogenase, propanol-preferring
LINDLHSTVMKAVVLRGFNEPLVVEERPEPTGSDVITVTACGVCHSDLHVVDGTYPSPTPLVLGHEVTGVHAELGPVMVYAPWGCRQTTCRWCGSGQEMICPNAREIGLFQDGGYTERFAVSDRSYLHALDGLDPVQSAPLACGGLTAYRAVQHALPLLRSGANRRVMVLGAGGLGQFAIQYLRLLSDATVIAGDLSAAKCETAVTLGAHAAGDPANFDQPVDVVLDFVGAPATLATAAKLVDRQGLVVLVGLFGGQVPFGLGLVPHEARLMTSIWGTNQQLAELLALARREPLRYTVETLPLIEAQTAHDRLRAGDVVGRFVLVP